MVRFDLGPLLQSQTGVAKLKSAYTSILVGLQVWDLTPTYRKSTGGSLLMQSDLKRLKGQSKIIKVVFIIYPMFWILYIFIALIHPIQWTIALPVGATGPAKSQKKTSCI